MMRPLIFILGVVFLAGTVTLLAGIDGRIEAEAFGAKFDADVGGAAVALLVALAAAVALTSVYKDLRRVPRDLAQRLAAARRARGVEAIARGLEAIAAGDAGAARRSAAIARRDFESSPLTRLLTAQSALLAGDSAKARENFAAMLAARDTEFLGLRGLYLQARRDDDAIAAREYAARAFKLRPTAAWAFESFLSLSLERGAWGEARDAVRTAARHKVIPEAKARRGEAALMTADAYAAHATGDAGLAMKEAAGAARIEPGFAPAAALAARLHAAVGKRTRAAKIIEEAFALEPHPALVAELSAVFADAPADARAERLRRLAGRRPECRESRLALVRAHLLIGEHSAAAAILEPLLRETPTVREFALMAEAVAGNSSDGGAQARAWLERAAVAPRDSIPGAGGFQFTREGWARLVREFMEYGRLAPPPLEERSPGLSEVDFQRLAPPSEQIPAPSSVARPASAPAAPVEKTGGEDERAAAAVAAAGRIS
jgi:HemY protein